MATGRGANGPSKKDRREAAREHARLLREEAQKKARRRKWWVQGSVGVVILAVLAVVALVIVNSIPQGQTSAGPKNMISDGIVLTSTTKAVRTPGLKAGEKPVATTQSDESSKAYITIYLDYQCPYCQQFETTNSKQIGQWLDQGIAQLEIHPIAMLDSSSNGHRYSSRATNAAACVANYEPDVYYAVNNKLFTKQPAEGTNGLTNAEILSILKKAGASSEKITKCVNNEKFKSWVTAATTRAMTKPLPNSSVKKWTGTPTIIVNGQTYSGSLTDASTFLSFVESTIAASSTSTPTPTPTATK
ncbi:DsbA family protein [Humibacter albus]|jgi:protein-disulfide isomerase|uniref:DsbA family protein n=1 Tax=Humibacter albus TaxID=427754 RepID=UPI0003B5D235|nr:thioredoxin domain-containing protein [Humibacter albus]